MDIKQIIRKIDTVIKKIDTWSLYYRTEIVWFAIGFIVGLVL